MDHLCLIYQFKKDCDFPELCKRLPVYQLTDYGGLWSFWLMDNSWMWMDVPGCSWGFTNQLKGQEPTSSWGLLMKRIRRIPIIWGGGNSVKHVKQASLDRFDPPKRKLQDHHPDRVSSLHTWSFWMIFGYVLILWKLSGWWFGTFFNFPYIGKNHPNWLLFFRGVDIPPSIYHRVSENVSMKISLNIIFDLWFVTPFYKLLTNPLSDGESVYVPMAPWLCHGC